MISLLRRMFKGVLPEPPAQQKESFASRFHRFKLFLSAHIDAYSEMMTFEERLASEVPVGMPFLRACTARLGIATMQCIMHVQALGGPAFARLNEPFNALRAKIQEQLSASAWPMEGPLVVPYHAVTKAHSPIISASVTKIMAIAQQHPEFVPSGFIVTGAAWWNFVQHPALHDEIDRIMLISQEDPNSYHEAAMAIRERILSSFTLLDNLKEELDTAFEELKEELATPGKCLLIRCLPVRAEHSALRLPEQVINTPITSSAALYDCLLRALTLPYRPRAMLYRLKLGIRDRAMPFCVCFSVHSAQQARGSAHRPMVPGTLANEVEVHLRRNYTCAEGESTLDVSSLPGSMLEELRQKSLEALVCLSDAPVQGNRHEIYWVVGEDGSFTVLGAMALPDPDPETLNLTLPADQGFIAGGSANYPGVAYGKPHLVRNFKDALLFPIGGILVVQQAAPRWTFLLDFASGAIACDGSGAGPFALTARRYGRPTLLQCPQVLEAIEGDTELLLIANNHGDSGLRPCPKGENTCPGNGLEECTEPMVHSLCQLAQDYKTRQCKGHSTDQGYLWLSGSDIAIMARNLAPLVASLSIPDSDALDFRAENCTTFHDFLAYCHDHAVREMFRHGTSSKSAHVPAKQLVCDVPKQFWVINLEDGFYGDIKGPAVKLEEIASVPMRTLWEGFSDKPWDGPPQLDAKGFLSVLFEATQNPNLDPASGASHYTEKNTFLISRQFCSMRCRFGFHFLSLDCFLSSRPRERFIVFQFKGGAANLSRRIRRVHFVAELLAQFDCSTEIVGDTLTARVEGGEEEQLLSTLRVIGYLVMHTRQLDMIMADEQALTIKRLQMLEDMVVLAKRPPMRLP